MSWLLFLHFLFQQNKSDDFFSVSAKCSYMKNRCVSSGSANIYSVVRIIEGVKNFNIIFCELPFSTAAAAQWDAVFHENTNQLAMIGDDDMEASLTGKIKKYDLSGGNTYNLRLNSAQTKLLIRQDK